MTDAQNLYRKEIHESILRRYKSKLPFYKRGSFKVYGGLVITVLWVLIWLEAAIRYFSLAYVEFSLMNPRIYIIPPILLALAIWWFKPQRVFTEKTYFGVIESVEKIKKNKKTHSSGKRIFFRTFDAQKLTVTDYNGKMRTKTVFISPSAPKLYEKGSVITVIAGENYPVPHSPDTIPENNVLCTKCGSLNADNYKYCFTCHHTMWLNKNI